MRRSLSFNIHYGSLALPSVFTLSRIQTLKRSKYLDVETVFVSLLMGMTFFLLEAHFQTLCAKPRITFHANTHATQRMVKMGELADLSGFSLLDRAQVAQLEMIEAPEVGASISLTRKALLQKAKLKIEAALSYSIEYQAPPKIEIDRIGFKISAKRLTRYIEDVAIAYGPLGHLKLSKVKVPKLSPLNIPEGATLTLTANAGQIPSRVPVDLELKGGGRVLRRQRLLVEVDYLQDVVVLTNQLAVGSILRKNDLEMIAVNAHKLPPSVIINPDDIVGAKLRQSVGPKIPLRKAWLWIPPLIKRGAKVVMTFRKGNLTISAEGNALSDGAKGDIIQIRNIQSKKTVSGRVIAPNHVEVEF